MQLKDTKFAREGIMLEKFFKMLESDAMRAWYGEAHVLKAAEQGAIGKLLISDEIFRYVFLVSREPKHSSLTTSDEPDLQMSFDGRNLSN